jgi:hypothetical protein
MEERWVLRKSFTGRMCSARSTCVLRLARPWTTLPISIRLRETAGSGSPGMIPNECGRRMAGTRQRKKTNALTDCQALSLLASPLGSSGDRRCSTSKRMCWSSRRRS